MYYYKDIETPLGDVVRQIFFWIAENRQINFPDIETNTGPERQAYLAWVAEGNTATEWQPEA
jgi:hypothetical protein